MTPKHQKVLDHWSSVYQDHAKLLEFLLWAEDEQHIEFKQISLPAKDGRRVAGLSDVLDVYFNIDRRALDDARCALLEDQREANNAGKTARPGG